MKRTLLLLAGLTLLLPGAAVADIQSSPHNLGSTTLYGTDQICIFCHTPHNPKITVPLWNHSLTTETFTQYWSTTINGWATGATWTASSSISTMCMSCHDGTVALGAVKNDGGGSGASNITSAGSPMGAVAARFGTDLSQHHPVSFTYNDSYVGELGDGELQTPTNVFGAAFIFGTNATSALVECASCHDPHYWVPADDERMPFLRQSNAGSAICLTCHIK